MQPKSSCWKDRLKTKSEVLATKKKKAGKHSPTKNNRTRIKKKKKKIELDTFQIGEKQIYSEREECKNIVKTEEGIDKPDAIPSTIDEFLTGK